MGCFLTNQLFEGCCMKKKIFVISIVLLLCFCSCGAKSSFVPQDEISFNYNNISAGQNNFWLTNDSLCYISNGLFPNYYLVTEQGAEKLSDYRGYGYTCYQCSNDIIYMADIEKEIDEYESEIKELKEDRFFSASEKVQMAEKFLTNCGFVLHASSSSGDCCTTHKDIWYYDNP